MLPSTVNKVQYLKGAGWTGPYSVTFKYWAKSEISAVLSFDDGVTADQTLILDTDYSLTDPADTGVLSVITTWSTSAVRLTILRTLTVDQETDYVTGQAIPAETIETDFDRAAARDQQVVETIGRTVLVPASDPSGTMTLPTYGLRASKFLAFDASGNPIASAGSGTPTTAAWAAVLDDATIAAGLTTMGFSTLMQNLRDDTTAAAAFATLSQSQIPNVFYDDYAAGVDPTTVHGTAEFVEAATIDCISSLGRAPEQAPYPKLVTWEPPYLGSIANPRAKFAGRGVVGVFPGTTNIISNPEDLTGSTWTLSGTCTRAGPYWQSDLGLAMTKLSSGGTCASAFVYGGSMPGTGTFALSALVRNIDCGATDYTYVGVGGYGAKITWAATPTVAIINGTYDSNPYIEIIDASTVRVMITQTNLSGLAFRVAPCISSNSKSVYVTQCMVEYNTTGLCSPYTPSARAAGTLKYHWPIPAAGTIAFWFRPTGYGGATAPAVYLLNFIEYTKSGATWASNNRLTLYWTGTANTMQLTLADSGGTKRINDLTDNTWSLTANTWAHVAMTWSGLGTASGAVTVYVNGTAKATFTLTGLALSLFAAGNASKLIIGSDGSENTPGVPAQQIGGLFTDILLDSVAWSAAELLAHVNSNKPWLDKNRVVSAQPGFRLDKYGNLTAKRVFNEIGELGSVVESGSNANGTYIKYSDGTLICRYAFTQTTSSTASNLYGSTSGTTYYGGPTWTFPHAFSATPSVVLGPAFNTGTARSACYSSLSAVSVVITLFSDTGNSVACSVLAIGRWKP